jgi:acyl-CoA thioesterase-2
MTHDIAVLLGLEQLGEHRFRGRPTQAVPTRIFGGQLVAQALVACGRTVAGARPVHSVHSYFLRPGRPDLALDYEVETLREGRTLSTREVTATQEGRPIFSLSASFHDPEPGPGHQARTMASVDVDPVPDRSQSIPHPEQQWFATFRQMFPFEIRFPDEPVRAAVRRNERPAPRQRVFLRWPPLPDDPLIHAAALAFMSDALLLSTSVYPHGRLFGDPGVSGSSLDHAIWFHRPPRADVWLLHEMESIWAGGARALCTGHLFTRDGNLVATVMQEGLIRIDREPPSGESDAVSSTT